MVKLLPALTRRNSNSTGFSFRSRRNTVAVMEASSDTEIRTPELQNAGFRAYADSPIPDMSDPGSPGKASHPIVQTELASVIPGVSMCDERLLLLSGMQPYIYIIIFINPYSGGQMGKELLRLRFQHFRLSENSRVQIQWYNLFDAEDKARGLDYLQWVLTAKESVNSLLRNAGRKTIEIYSIDQNRLTTRNLKAKSSGTKVFFDDENMQRLPAADQAFIRQHARKNVVMPFEVHVWSAGGDGTVMSVYDWLVSESISFSSIYFSCIPFGTGNDMSQALGWGRTVGKSLTTDNLANLINLTETRLTGDLALLDVWEITIETHPEGYIQEIHRNNSQEEKKQRLRRRFCSIFSMGVQGFVGMEFEPHRTKSRIHNIMQYTKASAKWVTMRKFPVITEVLDSIEQDGEVILKTRLPELYEDIDEGVRHRACETGPCPPSAALGPNAAAATATANQAPTPELNIHPIEIFIQNIPHIWGRDHDLWGQAQFQQDVVDNRRGPTLRANWTPQMSGDDKVECFVIENVRSYIHKQWTAKGSLGRIGQFRDHFRMNFRNPEVYQSFHTHSRRSSRRHQATPPGFTCLMIDGEFYELYLPKSITFRRHSCIRAIGSRGNTSRLVRDTQAYCREYSRTAELHRSGTDITARRISAANETQGPHGAAVAVAAAGRVESDLHTGPSMTAPLSAAAMTRGNQGEAQGPLVDHHPQPPIHQQSSISSSHRPAPARVPEFSPQSVGSHEVDPPKPRLGREESEVPPAPISEEEKEKTARNRGAAVTADGAGTQGGRLAELIAPQHQAQRGALPQTRSSHRNEKALPPGPASNQDHYDGSATANREDRSQVDRGETVPQRPTRLAPVRSSLDRGDRPSGLGTALDNVGTTQPRPNPLTHITSPRAEKAPARFTGTSPLLDDRDYDAGQFMGTPKEAGPTFYNTDRLSSAIPSRLPTPESNLEESFNGTHSASSGSISGPGFAIQSDGHSDYPNNVGDAGFGSGSTRMAMLPEAAGGGEYPRKYTIHNTYFAKVDFRSPSEPLHQEVCNVIEPSGILSSPASPQPSTSGHNMRPG